MHSRIEKTIQIPEYIKIDELINSFKINGITGTIEEKKNKEIQIEINENRLIIKSIINKKNYKKKNAIINTTKAIFKNHFNGLKNLFEKTIIIKGIGYKAEYKEHLLKLFLGFSHLVIIPIPQDIYIEIQSQTVIVIKGISKHKVGQIAHNIKSKKPADIYKGTGMKYKDEILKLKSPKKTK